LKSQELEAIPALAGNAYNPLIRGTHGNRWQLTALAFCATVNRVVVGSRPTRATFLPMSEWRFIDDFVKASTVGWWITLGWAAGNRH
jgi:hypothetical protein